MGKGQSDLLFRQLFDFDSSTYTYLLADKRSQEAILIDTVLEQIDRDLLLVQELGLQLTHVLETHVHADHVTAAGKIRERTGCTTVAGKGSGVTCADRLVEDGDTIRMGSFEIKALATPGHTDSCTSYLLEDMVFTGDTLLIRCNGRTDFQQGSPEKLFKSIMEKLYTLPDSTRVYPAHDYNGFTSSTIGEEKRFNCRIPAGQPLQDFVRIMKALKLADPKKMAVAVPANLGCGKAAG